LVYQHLHLLVKLVHLALRLLAHRSYGPALDFAGVFGPDHGAANGVGIGQQPRVFGYFIFINWISIFVRHTGKWRSGSTM
jgi:hypothetical protein